ncbi:MAG: SPFH domain-containing protein [Acidobacteriota bacterium]
MARITAFPGLHHLQSAPTSHVLCHRKGRLVRTGRGLSFWFRPLVTSLAEVPCDDRDEHFLFHERSSDFQDVTVQGVVTYRIADPEAAASRIDFRIDPRHGQWTEQPFEQLTALFTNAAQQHAKAGVAGATVRELVTDGAEVLRESITAGLAADTSLSSLGLEIVSVRVASVSPSSELERALQAPTAEALQQEADEAVFQRRALAVEKERAIAENELQNRIELARREEQLIAQEGRNGRDRANEAAAAERIEVEAKAERRRLLSASEADALRTVEGAKVEAERERMDIHRELPSHVLMGLALKELAGKLQRIDHLNVSPDMLGPALANLAMAGTKHLQGGPEGK